MANLTLKCMAVANYIIDEINKYNEDKPFREKILLSVRRLQKLLYFCETEYMKKIMVNHSLKMNSALGQVDLSLKKYIIHIFKNKMVI